MNGDDDLTQRPVGSEPSTSGPVPRSWLFVPGAAERYIAKLATVRPDAAILDLEDGIAARDVDESRARVALVLAAGASDRGRSGLPAVVAVRTHAVASNEFAADCGALGPGLSVLMLPKVAGAGEVREAAAVLERAGRSHARIVVMIESAAGLEDLSAILAAHPAVVGVAFGAEDFAADIGLPPSLTGPPASSQEARVTTEGGRLAVLDAARARLVTAAAAAGVPWRIDTPVLQLRPVDLVEAEARRSRAMGFGGKFVIHPSHVGAVHLGYAPSAAEVAWARTVVGSSGVDADPAAADLAAGGATAGGGQMIDEAVARQARAVLAAAAAQGTTRDAG